MSYLAGRRQRRRLLLLPPVTQPLATKHEEEQNGVSLNFKDSQQGRFERCQQAEENLRSKPTATFSSQSRFAEAATDQLHSFLPHHWKTTVPQKIDEVVGESGARCHQW